MSKNAKKHFRSISSYVSIGAAGLLVMSSLTGCEQKQDESSSSSATQNQAQGYFIVIQEVGNSKYKIVEQYYQNRMKSGLIMDDFAKFVSHRLV